jgi:putative pyruvate formate lyase activating enzyme
LDVLYVYLLKGLNECGLCEWECKINRYQKQGKCGLGVKIHTSKSFIHIAEEMAINPAIVINFGGCALRCRYCVEHQNWDVKNLSPSSPKELWTEIAGLLDQNIPANSLEFTNPTESLVGLVGILTEAPIAFKLPVILNCHLYGSRFSYEMGNWITDVWLPDLRYGNDRCAKALSGADNYMQHARDGLGAMLENGAQVIVRILVLPGHVDCCHQPAIELLSAYREKVWVSILDQYIPEYEAHLDPNLKRRPTREEISRVEDLVDRYGLRNIALDCDDFWSV